MRIKKHAVAAMALLVMIVIVSRVWADPPTPPLPPPPPLPSITSTAVFLVTNYGAVGDGTTDNTAAIQNAINAAAANPGGGTVEIPNLTTNSSVYETQQIKPASNVNLQIDTGAQLQAVPFSSYHNHGTNTNDMPSLIFCASLTNFEITGGGMIDGNGPAWWKDFHADSTHSRPILIEMRNCSTVLVQGIMLHNAPKFNLTFSNCNNVTVDGLIVRAPGDWLQTDPTLNSPNTDAIDVNGNNFLIQNCDLSEGDDNVAINGQNGSTSTVTVRHCTMGRGHGVSIGSYTNFGVSDIHVDDVTFSGTLFGIRFKTATTRSGGTTYPIHDLHYSNITMTGVNYPIIFYDYYDPSDSYPMGKVQLPADPRSPPATVIGTTPVFTGNNTFVNLLAIQPPPTGRAGVIWGLPESPINGIKLQNVRIIAPNGFVMNHVRNVSFDGNCQLTVANGADLVGTQEATATRPVDVQVVQEGYTNEQINSPALPIDASSISLLSLYDPTQKIWTMDNKGSGVGGTSDQFAFSWQPILHGSVFPNFFDARVLKIWGPDGQTPPNLQAGVMCRASDDPADPYAAVVQTFNSQIIFEYRTNHGGAVTRKNVIGAPPMGLTYLRIAENGNKNFTGLYSTDDRNWTRINNQAVTISNMPATSEMGVIVISDGTNDVAEAQFANVGASTLTLPFIPYVP